MRTLLIIVLFSIYITSCKSKSEKNTKTETTTIETKISNEDHKAYINVVLNPKNESNVNGKVRFTQSEDIVKMLNWDISKAIPPKQTRLFLDLTNDEQKIVDFLELKEQAVIDAIALETQLPLSQLVTILLQLEFKNIVKPFPGKIFKLS